MFEYCLDTSGLSNPYIEVPPTIYKTLWQIVYDLIDVRTFCWTKEIDSQLSLIRGDLGAKLREQSSHCCYEIGTDNWPWREYIDTIDEWHYVYQENISEYNGNRKNTIDLADLSIVALAKVLEKPVLSMEKPSPIFSSSRRLRIPDLCVSEDVEHVDFNTVLLQRRIVI